MANITLSLNDEIIKKVKKIAAENETTLTGLVRNYLNQIAAEEDQRKEEVITELAHIMGNCNISVGKITWNRADLHER
mgnify:CR=1 FL=1